MLLYIVLACFLYRWIRPSAPHHVLNVYFGVPGSGKTTFAAYLAKRNMKRSFVIALAEKYPCKVSSWLLEKTHFFKRAEPVWSNVPITGSFQLDPQVDIGRYMICGGKVIIDEAGIEYNNRKFKSFPAEAIYWYKYHRHYQCSVDVFSQSFEDMDITLRRLAQNYYVVKKSFFPYFVVTKRIRRKVGIDDITHQIIDQYYFGFPVLDTKWVFSPPLWKLFNSFSRKELPEKAWQKW